MGRGRGRGRGRGKTKKTIVAFGSFLGLQTPVEISKPKNDNVSCSQMEQCLRKEQGSSASIKSRWSWKIIWETIAGGVETPEELVLSQTPDTSSVKTTMSQIQRVPSCKGTSGSTQMPKEAINEPTSDNVSCSQMEQCLLKEQGSSASIKSRSGRRSYTRSWKIIWRLAGEVETPEELVLSQTLDTSSVKTMMPQIQRVPSCEGTSGSTQMPKEAIDEKAQMKPAADAPWANLFSGNRVAENGMSLSYLPPQLVNGTPTIQLDKEEEDKEVAKRKSSLVAYVFGELPEHTHICRYLAGLMLEHLTSYLLEKGWYIIKFHNMVDMQEVLHSGPYTISNRPITLKP